MSRAARASSKFRLCEPLLPKLGPKYGPQVADIRRAIAAGDVEVRDDGTARVGSFTLEEDEYEHRSQAADGYALAEDAEWVVAVSTSLDDELIAEGRAREIVRALQALRKQSGLDISDRVEVSWQTDDDDLVAVLDLHGSSIADEVLATRFAPSKELGDTAHVIIVDGHELRVLLRES